ncbi:MAG TPA: histidine phosphatase family protein [Candidatus Baltobacteraceae bacterium]|nr:histidine phosphatase family protein [Candidatus Baltobacteraceae bacterium]
MKLYFLRHGAAVDPETWQGDDASRPLTADGRKSMEREAKAMDDLDLGLTLIVTSPLKRARETAEIVACRLKLEDRLIQDGRLAQNVDGNVVAEILRDHGAAETVMFVGHEPDFSRTIGELSGGANIVLKKGGLARIDLADSTSTSGEMVWLIPPKLLVR